MLHYVVLLFEKLTDTLNDLQNHQQYFKCLKCDPKKGFAPFALGFETVSVSGVRRVVGTVLHEQRFFLFVHNKLLREPLSIVSVAPSRERVGAYRTTHLIPLGMAQVPGLGHAGHGASGGQAVCRPVG